MIGQISASNQLRTSSELAPNMFGASYELASVMGFGFMTVAIDDSQARVDVGVAALGTVQPSVIRLSPVKPVAFYAVLNCLFL